MAKSARKAERNVPRKRVIARAPPPPSRVHNFTLEGSAILLVVLALFLSFALGSQLSRSSGLYQTASELGISRENLMGQVGSLVAHILLSAFGYCSFVLVVWILLVARNICVGWKPVARNSVFGMLQTAVASLVLLASCAVIASVLFGYAGGGKFGTQLALRLIRYVNEGGTLLIAGTLMLLSLGISTGIGAEYLFRGLQAVFGTLIALLSEGLMMLKSIATGVLRIVVSPYRKRRAKADSARTDELEKPYTLDGSNQPAWARRKSVRRLPPVDLDDSEEFSASELHAPKTQSNVLILRRSGVEELKRTDSRRGAAPSRMVSTKAKLRVFPLPSPEFLVRGESSLHSSPKDQELIQNSRKLELTLQNFRIGGKVVEVHPGPVITLYQFEPAPGVKVQKIISLADDLALSLKVASVRVYAPVPGKGTVGIEVPNAHREIVRLRDLIETKAFHDPQFQIALALGKDTFGDPFITDLAKMPHLLIAGATGTGKSVCINSLLLSLIYRNSPQDLRLILIDPKMLELSVYEDIPHLKAPVVTLAKRARGVLWWAVEEMEHRYALMKELGVRNLASFNTLVSSGEPPGAAERQRRAEIIELLEKDVVSTSSDLPALDRELDDSVPAYARKPNTALEPLPRIVIVVDELADLMLTVGREIEELLTRLAQKARAAGIHLILATQRPSVNVITGLIKANFPSRISFKVASRIDARTVLDNSGAEKLLGQGDMLFLSPGAGRPKRLHSPFVSDKEVHDVVDYLRAQGRPDYDAQIEQMIERIERSESASAGGEPGSEEYDPLYDQAVNLVIERGMASTSMVQRVFRIGYNRAARMLETMERDGIVGPADGAKPRQVFGPHRDTGM